MAVAATGLSGARRSATAGGGRLRLTRRGRVAVVVFFLLSLTGLVLVLAPASRAGGPPGPDPVDVVQPGDTLWSVAERHLPGRDPFATIAEIRRLNGLPDNVVHPGQRLALPARR
ncbi:LysM peptidoglycan-binding domain-containing protein [Micromonospora zhanjiangensis]